MEKLNIVVGSKSTLDITMSKSGLPCLYECGGGYTHTGFSQLISGPKGQKKLAVVIFKHGPRACANQAVLRIWPGDLVYRAKLENNISSVEIYRVKKILIDKEVCEVEAVKPQELNKVQLDIAMLAAQKCTMYHCRDALYVEPN